MEKGELTDINARRGLPRTYRFNPLIRWTTMFFAALAFGYAVWVLMSGRITANTGMFFKVVPFLIMFLAINSLLKNLLSLDRIRFEPQRLRFRFIARKSVNIAWSELRGMKFMEGRMRLIRLQYERDGQMRQYDFSINFPNMLEIVNAIFELAPHIEVDEFLGNVLVQRKLKPRPEPEKPEE